MNYMNERDWTGSDMVGNEAADGGVTQDAPENEAADTSGIQDTSEELGPVE